MIERLILHAGTPKTGTTSLQIALDTHREALAAGGVFYPEAMATGYAKDDGTSGVKPKHQWLVDRLMEADAAPLANQLRAVLGKAPRESHTVVLSTEGIFTHWWDFSTEGRSALRSLAAEVNIEVWGWFRPPLDFATSFYVQMLKNPRTHVSCHGRDWGPEEMLDDAWFIKHLDYAGFVDDVRELLGPRAIRVFRYRGSTLHDFLEATGLGDLAVREPWENVTLGEFGVETVRALNRRELSAETKAAAVNLITLMDKELGPASPRFRVPEHCEARIRGYCAPGLARLHRELGLDFTSEAT